MELAAIRRDLHAHPELGLEEHRTAAVVAEHLRAWGIETTTGVGGTGVVGTIKGNLPGQRAIGLRADMDALALTEQTGLPYASTYSGRMHACGHDGHTTMLLGAARQLAEHKDFAGTVHLIFQPAEEGRGGAKAMLADGLFERFPCDAVYGMHNSPGVPVGRFVMRRGACMAGGAQWRVRFTGKGGHGGAAPHLTADLSIVQAHFVLGLQTVVGRNVPPMETALISVGYIQGGSSDACNVLPSALVVGGTARYFKPAVKETIDRRIRELAQQLAAMHGAGAEVDISWGAIPLVNHEAQCEVGIAAAGAVVGAGAIGTKGGGTTGGEDFAFMLDVRPGAFIGIGNGVGADGSYHGLHSPTYDFNDEIIPLGVAYWVELVNQELNLAP
jgi:hippurate hydrolase